MNRLERFEVARPGKAAGLLVGAGLMAVLGVAAATNPPITVASKTLMERVPDQSISSGGTTRNASNLGTFVVVGDDAYATKTDTSDTNGTGWTSFIHIDNFRTSSPTLTPHTVHLGGSSAPADMGHANGMAYYRWPGSDPLEVGSFYIAMTKAVGDYQVAQVNNQGEITARFKARQGSTEKKIASITYYRDGIFIVGTAGENIADPSDANQILKPYYKAVIDGNYFELGARFYVPTTGTFNVGQDISYYASNDELLVPVWDGKSTVDAPTGRKNRVISVRLGAIEDGHVYFPTRWIDLTVPAADAQKFEIEGISRADDGILFVGSNITNPDGTVAIDGIHKLAAAN